MHATKYAITSERFYFDRSIPITIAIAVTPETILAVTAFIGFHSLSSGLMSLAVAGTAPLLVWLALSVGTYITVESELIYGTVLFFRSRTSEMKNILSIHRKSTFGGIMTEVYMMYRDPSGAVADRGLVLKNSLKKSDFLKLIEAIHKANPNIRIDENLFPKALRQ